MITTCGGITSPRPLHNFEIYRARPCAWNGITDDCKTSGPFIGGGLSRTIYPLVFARLSVYPKITKRNNDENSKETARDDFINGLSSFITRAHTHTIVRIHIHRTRPTDVLYSIRRRSLLNACIMARARILCVHIYIYIYTYL